MEDTRVLHYEVGRLLGRGGMGEVYEARDTRLGRRVALKFITPALAGDAEAVRRFEREAQAAAALAHPHIATVYALEHDGGRLFIATELLPGGSLREHMRRGALPVAEALGLARDVAAALAHAHHRGVVHRDIKPENLMFADGHAIKVTDFGLAQLAHASHLTQAGTTLGTASYMAPEAVQGRSGERADVFALGVTLYEMLAGRLPFGGQTPLTMLYAIANAPAKPLGESRPGLEPAVEALVISLLAKSPQARPTSDALAARLAELTGVAYAPQDAGVSGARGVPADATADTIEVRNAGTAAPVTTRARTATTRRVWWAGAGIAALVVVLGWAAYQALRLRTFGGPATTTAARLLAARTLADEAAHFLTEGLPDSAAARANAALRLDGDNASARINLAQVLRMRGESTRAAALLSEVTRSPSADHRLRAAAWDALGDMALGDQTWPEAVRALEQSFALDSTERAYSQLGYALVRAARPGQALMLLRRGIATFPGSAALHKNAGYALLQLDSLRASRFEVERAIALDPGFGPALGLRARLEARAGDRRAAAGDWRAFLAAHPAPADSAEVAMDLARAGGIR